MTPGYLVSLLVKLAAMAAVASVVARSNTFKSMIMGETRTLPQRLTLAMWLAVVFAFSAIVRVEGPAPYEAVDLTLEGSLIAGLLGGYVSGLTAGILIALRRGPFDGETDLVDDMISTWMIATFSPEVWMNFSMLSEPSKKVGRL